MSYVAANTSNPLGRRGLGWDNAPYPRYPQPRSMTRLNGPADGALTYRIDPRTGGYRFYNTDIRPRGVFLQNTFQHPAPPTMSALGVQIGRGTQILKPGCGAKHSCKCGGKCKTRVAQPPSAVFARRRSNRRLGDDTFIDSATGCELDSDGNL